MKKTQTVLFSLAVLLSSLHAEAATIKDTVQLDRNIWVANRSWYGGYWHFSTGGRYDRYPAGATIDPNAEPAIVDDGLHYGYARARGGDRPELKTSFTGHGGTDWNDSIDAIASAKYEIDLVVENYELLDKLINQTLPGTTEKVVVWTKSSGYANVQQGSGRGSANASIAGYVTGINGYYLYPDNSVDLPPHVFSFSTDKGDSSGDSYNRTLPLWLYMNPAMLRGLADPNVNELSVQLSARTFGYGAGYAAEAYIDPIFWIDPIATFTIDGVEYKQNEIFSLHFSEGVTSPVPVPATMLLFSTGLAGLLGIRRKLKK